MSEPHKPYFTSLLWVDDTNWTTPNLTQTLFRGLDRYLYFPKEGIQSPRGYKLRGSKKKKGEKVQKPRVKNIQYYK